MDPIQLAVERLETATGALADGGESRPGQIEMTEAVARAIDEERHLVVTAGTGTGKSLAYLAAAWASDKRTVVATATKALQDQLASADLPHLRAACGGSLSYAVLKGRSNYLCRQRLDEALNASDQLALDGLETKLTDRDLKWLDDWAATTTTGDRDDLDEEPDGPVWAAVSVSARECPGAANCPRGDDCFAEQARYRAHAADIIVVNTHLLGAHLAADNGILPEHDVCIIDEAHQLEDVISATNGAELTAGRFRNLARVSRAILADDELTAELESAGNRLEDQLLDHRDERVRPDRLPELLDALVRARQKVGGLLSGLAGVPDDRDGTEVGARRTRAVQAATVLANDLDFAMQLDDEHVAWIDGPVDRPVLHIAPIDVGDVLAARLWPGPTTVLTSATLPSSLPDQVGMPKDETDVLAVDSPFDYEHQSLLYCAADLPDPRQPGHDEAADARLGELITAAGGRTLALFTSWRGLRRATESLADELPGPLLAQGDLPKPRLVEAFAEDESASLFATMGFWQGIDVPGPTLSLVVLDRLPFPRPDDPLLQARRERFGREAFRLVDLPRAATLLAQGAGRLIRRRTDRGVVAVLDPRLATNASYRWDIINALPPMRRTRNTAEVVAFLTEIAALTRA